MTATTGVVLVDWDNIVRISVRTPIDAESAVEEAFDAVVTPVLESCTGLDDLQLRLYGSWQWNNGRSTGFSVLISDAAHRSGRRVGQTFVTAATVSSLAVESEYDRGPRLTPFLSPSKCRCSAARPINEQKLADTMIVSDAIYFAQFPDYAVVVASDDIDMAPGLMVAASIRESVGYADARDVVWLRPTADTAVQSRRFGAFFRVI